MAFVYGHGGTGKTFLWTTIISALCSRGARVLAVAASGIASLLLPSGRTTHSHFKIHIDLTSEYTCHIKKNTHLGHLLTETTLIIWDEAPMNNRKCFESLDKTLRDMLNNPHVPFGGKSLLLGGDFRQTLPIIPKASKNVILMSSLPRSYLWHQFRLFKSTKNMRLHSFNIDIERRAMITSFSSWLLAIGDGRLGNPIIEDPENIKDIMIPLNFVIPYDDTALLMLIRFIYNDATLENPTPKNLRNKAIIEGKVRGWATIEGIPPTYETGESSAAAVKRIPKLTGEPVARTIATLAAPGTCTDSQIASLRGKCTQLDRHTEILQDRCLRFGRRIDTLENRVGGLDDHGIVVDGRMGMLSGQMGVIEDRVSLLEENGVVDNDVRNQLHFRLEKLERDSVEMREKLEEAQRQAMEAKGRVEVVAEASVSSLEQRLVTSEEHISAAVALAVVSLTFIMTTHRGGRTT